MEQGQLPRLAAQNISVLHETDPRADGQRRSVNIERRRIKIDRTVNGIDMQVDVPAQSYYGVVLSHPPAAAPATPWRIMLVHHDPDLSLILYHSDDDADVVAIWNEWSDFFSLPRLVEHPDGALDCADVYVGGLAMGRAPRWRRRGGTLANRRPRFFTRRKPGNPLRMMLNHAGEREIIART